MANYSVGVSTTGTTSFPAAPDITIPFEPRFMQFTVETATSQVLISFDGVNEHSKLIGTTGPHTMEITGRNKIWLRVPTGTSPAAVRVAAWNV